MTALLVYASVLLLGIAVIVNRRGERRLAASRREMAQDQRVLRSLDRRLADGRRRAAAAEEDVRAAQARVAEAQRALDAAERRLADARRLPLDQYWVFDRQEAKGGRIWMVLVTQSAVDPLTRDGRTGAVWSAPRRWLVVAGSRKDATDRVTLRYARSAGYTADDAVPCPLFPAAEDGERPPRPAGATPRQPATLRALRDERSPAGGGGAAS